METKKEAKRPKVKLTGEDGNAFYILGKVHKALVRAGLTEEADRKSTRLNSSHT